MLDDRERRSVYLAEGLGHAFLALEDDSTVMYLCSAAYAPDREHTINALDPTLDIAWPAVDGEPIMSDRDREAPTLAESPGGGSAADVGRDPGVRRRACAAGFSRNTVDQSLAPSLEGRHRWPPRCWVPPIIDPSDQHQPWVVPGSSLQHRADAASTLGRCVRRPPGSSRVRQPIHRGAAPQSVNVAKELERPGGVVVEADQFHLSEWQHPTVER